MQVDKKQIIEHLTAMIEIEGDSKTGTVLRNLRQELIDDEFAYGKPFD